MDEFGEWPIVVGDGELPSETDGVSFRYVCDVGTVEEGHAACSAWLSRRLSDEDEDGSRQAPTPSGPAARERRRRA